MYVVIRCGKLDLAARRTVVSSDTCMAERGGQNCMYANSYNARHV